MLQLLLWAASVPVSACPAAQRQELLRLRSALGMTRAGKLRRKGVPMVPIEWRTVREKVLEFAAVAPASRRLPDAEESLPISS